jgi:uncharacterized membrane protein YphA (DoxX/SURF4 family)
MNENLATLGLWRIKVICRWSLGLVWIWEGLIPKILWPTAMQRELVLRSGLYWPDPDRFLWGLGAAMIVGGVILCAGWLERWAVATATFAMAVLIVLVTGNRPESLSDMHGGIPKDLCLIACAWTVWRLAPFVPRRDRTVVARSSSAA